jgi:hypothetical protein
VLLGPLVVVPGEVEALPAFQGATGAPAGRIVLPAFLAALPVFSTTGAGLTSMIAISGSHERPWTLSVLETAFVPPLPAPEPLTTLPGAPVAALPLPAAPQ